MQYPLRPAQAWSFFEIEFPNNFTDPNMLPYNGFIG